MSLITRFHAAIAEVAPINGVSIVDESNRSTWTIDFAPEATIEQQSAADALRLSWVDPGEPVFLSSAVMLTRLTDPEYAAIMQAAAAALAGGNGQLSRWIDTARVRGRIELAHADTVAAKAALVGAGLLTQERADVILGPE